jgi:hypothetical protein
VTVTKTLVAFAGIMCAGSLLVACSSLPFGGATNQLENIIAVTAAGTYEVSYVVKRDGVILLTQTVAYECTQDAGKLTGCHKRDPVPPAAMTVPK